MSSPNFDKATGRPWVRGIDSDSERVQIINAAGQHVCYIEIDPLNEHADLVCAAVNSYDARRELVEAAKDLLWQFLDRISEPVDSEAETVNRMQSALAAVEAAEKGATR